MTAIDAKAGTIVFETLKKCTRGVFRAVSVPPTLLEMLALVHDLKRAFPQARSALANRAHPAPGKSEQAGE